MSELLHAGAPAADNPFAAGAAYIDGRYMPIGEAAIPITDWGYRRSDVTYDVVGVWDGRFFRLDEHLTRFRASMDKFRFSPGESDADIRAVLHRCVALSGLRNAYVAMDCLRGRPGPGMPYHPIYARNYIAAFAIPWVWVMAPAVQERGAHLVIAETLRIPQDSVDPTAKNFHWADLTRGQFEAYDRDADFCLLLDRDGNVTEGPGFNVFFVIDGRVVTPDAGVLEGITRRSVFDLCDEMDLPWEARRVSAAEAREADEIFLSTTAGGIMPAARIDGRIMGNDRPGAISTGLRERFWSRRAEGWHGTPVDYSAAD
ncbi:aminotransferase class IV [Lichenihabitans psoromatis]|uniref:aminotransferase class IV n=1 Tax=Lichenihabitans psoromatis TaxID=2528642 RepID=UPI0010367C59|nr:aminotransferase class IV [Lichenihabitans psoromatis]